MSDETEHKALHSAEQVAADAGKLLGAFYDKQVRAAFAADPAYGRLWSSLSKLASAGGKRLRPYMTVLGYEIYGGDDYKGVLPIAASQELLHLSLLIHDDIADQATVRYGIQNVTGQYVSYYGGHGVKPAAARHYADAAALLAGDMLLSSAYAMILDAAVTASQKQQAQQLLAESMFNVAAGQLLDMESGSDIGQPVDAFKIARLKTASYSFVNPLRCGALLAGAPADEAARLASFGATLGLAFQLVDDMLGVFGDRQVTGKSNLTDLRDGKHTFLMQMTRDRATPDQLAIVKQYFGKADLDDVGAGRIREVIAACGAKQAVEETVGRYYRKALHQADTLQVPEAAKQALHGLVEVSTRRNY